MVSASNNTANNMNAAQLGVTSIGSLPNGTASMIGEVAEVIYFNSKLEKEERVRAETYLAIKYGITLGNNTNPVSYISLFGGVFWTGSTSYQNNIAGLGRNDNTRLHQRQGFSQTNIS